MILAITMCMSIGFYNLAILIPFFHDLYSISRAEALRSPFAPRFVYVSKIPSNEEKEFFKKVYTNEEKEFW